MCIRGGRGGTTGGLFRPVRFSGGSRPARNSCAGSLGDEPLLPRMEFSDAASAEIPILHVSGIPPEARALVQEIKRQAHLELLKRLNVKRMLMSGTAQEVLENKAKETIHEIMSELSIPCRPA